MTISVNSIVQVTPSVLSAGGRALDLIGVILTKSARVPIGDVHPFPDADSVAEYFGAGSDEAAIADIYFLGYDNSRIKPSRCYFTQYPEAAVAPYLRGGNISGYTLAQLQAIATGTLTVTFDGSPEVAATVNLSAATSFSNAAAIIEAAFTTPPFSVSYDSTSGSFVFTGDTTGVAHTVGYAADNTLSQALKLTSATGAVLSQGADAAAPGTFMDGVKALTQNWASFMTIFDPDVSGNTNKLAFSAWCNSQNKRFVYTCWDTDDQPAVTVPATASLGYLLAQNKYEGTCIIGSDNQLTVTAAHAAFICGSGAAVDFTRHNNRITFAFKHQTGLAFTCSNDEAAQNLQLNGYNFYGAYATANDEFSWFINGTISGTFKWLDSYFNQIWLNNQLQLALAVLLDNAPSIPYNDSGYALIKAAVLDPINQALNFGAIRAGVSLSEAQKAEVNDEAGVDVSGTLFERGWYFQVLDANAQTRQARQSPPCTLWYMDGQSVQRINLASINIQ